jgi:hypothetical protein
VPAVGDEPAARIGDASQRGYGRIFGVLSGLRGRAPSRLICAFVARSASSTEVEQMSCSASDQWRPGMMSPATRYGGRTSRSCDQRTAGGNLRLVRGLGEAWERVADLPRIDRIVRTETAKGFYELTSDAGHIGRVVSRRKGYSTPWTTDVGLEISAPTGPYRAYHVREWSRPLAVTDLRSGEEIMRITKGSITLESREPLSVSVSGRPLAKKVLALNRPNGETIMTLRWIPPMRYLTGSTLMRCPVGEALIHRPIPIDQVLVAVVASDQLEGYTVRAGGG